MNINISRFQFSKRLLQQAPGSFTRALVIVVFILSSSIVNSQVLVSFPDKLVNLAYTAEYIEDPKGEVKISDLLQRNNTFHFNRVNKEVIEFGLTSSYFWIRSTIVNRTNERLFIKICSNPLTDIVLYEAKGRSVIKSFHAGNWLPFGKREVKSIDYFFPLQLPKDSAVTMYLRVRHLRGTQFPLYTGTLKAFYVTDIERVFLDGIYFGLMLLMMVYNLFIYFSLKDKSYLFYVIYVFMITLLNASLDGYAFQYLWPSIPAINPYEDIIAALVGLSGILFVTTFLNTKENFPIIHKVFMGLFVAFLLIIGIIAFGYFAIGSQIMEIASLISVLTTFCGGLFIMKKGYKPAKFFLIAWSFLLFSIVVFIFKDFNLLPYNNFTINSIQIGSAAEALLLSIALADRIRLFRQEKARAQRELIQSLQEKATMQHEMLELEAKALRSQMNPHFIFNCMNSIKSLIQQKEDDKAVTYLTTFSKLLRTILQNLDKREISLFDEIETCRLYTELESMRFGEKFTYSFSVNPAIDVKSIQVPALILQPFIENAIWHGIMPKGEDGHITVSVEKVDDAIVCIIDDNGIGREMSGKRNVKHYATGHQSKGVSLTQSRLDLDNALHNRSASVTIVDKKDNEGNAEGTTVIVSFKEY